jgi:hypothetical protein
MSPRRENSSRRRPPRQRSRTVLVLCSGSRTEPEYLDGLRQAYRRSGLKIRVIAKPRDPESLVRHAQKVLTLDGGELDEVWCVVDVDEFELDAASRLSERAGVSLAVSNPCFELWLLLHFDDCHSHVDGAADAVRRLARHLPAYDKARLVFADFAPGVEEAIERATSLDDGQPVGPNPSSAVWRLVSMITKEQQ